ncbi:LOW QUALITY PROTEIN: hypothetical protein BU14_0058s0036 [Porphyra umbilicalis]|uniref:Uncharacterized protein n=1 Tax=Porphyra umbilicalis TaxID=2786 RepID=A0A1X6PH83_PORUM|nr:LOW QUALITY PROTEIN: hypothetical protein BU14_0058s0036 [Porphyra umbilicalis]|eukprot:OSX80125.1 LOW QUALITY PROTEIN: hypothetical protein BU14_0058s0036 [Porphyra umbilicalis]
MGLVGPFDSCQCGFGRLRSLLADRPAPATLSGLAVAALPPWADGNPPLDPFYVERAAFGADGRGCRCVVFGVVRTGDVGRPPTGGGASPVAASGLAPTARDFVSLPLPAQPQSSPPAVSHDGDARAGAASAAGAVAGDVARSGYRDGGGALPTAPPHHPARRRRHHRHGDRCCRHRRGARGLRAPAAATGVRPSPLHPPPARHVGGGTTPVATAAAATAAALVGVGHRRPRRGCRDGGGALPTAPPSPPARRRRHHPRGDRCCNHRRGARWRRAPAATAAAATAAALVGAFTPAEAMALAPSVLRAGGRDTRRGWGGPRAARGRRRLCAHGPQFRRMAPSSDERAADAVPAVWTAVRSQPKNNVLPDPRLARLAKRLRPGGRKHVLARQEGHAEPHKRGLLIALPPPDRHAHSLRRVRRAAGGGLRPGMDIHIRHPRRRLGVGRPPELPQAPLRLPLPPWLARPRAAKVVAVGRDRSRKGLRRRVATPRRLHRLRVVVHAGDAAMMPRRRPGHDHSLVHEQMTTALVG